MSEQVLFSHPWVEIRDRDGWEYVHQPCTRSRGIAILPFRDTPQGRQYLARWEPNPGHHSEAGRVDLVSITGGMDHVDQTERECARQELIEEGGLNVRLTDIVVLGEVYAAKMTDLRYTLFTVQVNDTTPTCDPMGDGSELEEIGYPEWVDQETLFQSEDPLVFTLWALTSQVFPES